MGQAEIIDVHLHAWWVGGWEVLFNPHGPAVTDEQIFADTLAQMDALGISKSVLSGPNLVTLDYCRRAPDRFIPIWGPDWHLTDRVGEEARFEEAIEAHGFRGLGEIAMQYAGIPVNDDRFYPLYEICQARHLPVLLHTWFDGRNFLGGRARSFRVRLGDPLLVEDIAAAFPDLKIVMAHMGYPFVEQATYMLYAHSNVYMDVSTVNWFFGRAAFHRWLRGVVETVGPDKVLYGSDKMNRPERIPVAVSAVRDAPFLSEEDKHKILGDNARRLLGIE
jgi:predicted TIM-barrel fold metal-dependent hydrolase